MKNLILLSLIAFLFACQAPSAESVTKEVVEAITPSKRAPLIHTVFFYLKEDVTQAQKVAFVKGLEKLGTCESISNWRIGKPAATEARDVVDNGYAYAYILEFENIEAQDAYQVDKLHTDMIEEFQDLWSGVKVFDSMMMN